MSEAHPANPKPQGRHVFYLQFDTDWCAIYVDGERKFYGHDDRDLVLAFLGKELGFTTAHALDEEFALEDGDPPETWDELEDLRV